jgi:hypothetical protein
LIASGNPQESLTESLLWDVLRIEGKNYLKPGDEHAFTWDVRYSEKQKARSGFPERAPLTGITFSFN